MTVRAFEVRTAVDHRLCDPWSDSARVQRHEWKEDDGTYLVGDLIREANAIAAVKSRCYDKKRGDQALGPRIIERPRHHMMPTDCPDFDLAPLEGFSPGALAPEKGDPINVQRTKKLTLTLALVFNDLKLISWTKEQLKRGRRPSDPTRISRYAGQWYGMSGSANRLGVGLLVELGKVLQDNNKLLNEEPLLSCIGKLKGKKKAAWNDLMDFANGRRSKSGLTAFLRSIRNEVAFHYDVKQDGETLMNGYRTHFSKKSADAQYAYVSLGETMETTRFYFADAAVSEVISTKSAAALIASQDLESFGQNVNVALRFIVEEMIKHFASHKLIQIVDAPPPN